MKTIKFFLLLCLAVMSGVSLAQSGTEGRGSPPTGTSQDGSRPADGAIQGGSARPDKPSAEPERDVMRCYSLEGVLRDQCLRDLNSASGSSSPRAPAAPSPEQRDPATEPPPQNPR
jgi:hypothetical protein